MKKTGQIISEVTDGLIGTAVNGVLYWMYVAGESVGKSKTSYGAYQMFHGADEALRDFNYGSFKHILTTLRRQGYISKKKANSKLEILITQKGKERIRAITPLYHHNRPWDGYLYLISYDIPEERHQSRNLLRQYLKRQGCALLQESLWLTPYNPRQILDEFASEHQINGTILVSKLGQDGAIGDEKLAMLLERVYHLSELNKRYIQFIYEAKQKTMLQFALVSHYDRILKDDPQLPFALVPADWQGDAAYQILHGK